MIAPTEISEHFIDIEKLFGTKNPKLLRILPKFIFQYLRRIIHEDQVNSMIYEHRHKSGLEFVAAILNDFGCKIKVSVPRIIPEFRSQAKDLDTSAANERDSSVELSHLIPQAGRFIIAANHPLGGLDGLALLHVVGKVRPDIVFPVNDLLMFIPGLQALFIPINKHGTNNENVRIIEDTFASDKTILYFPAGLVSRKSNKGVIKDLDWKKTFISKSKKYKRDIIPVYISGHNSDFFYNLANWRRKIGVKANIEMLYLPGEMFKQKDKLVEIIFGEPVPYTTFDKSRSDVSWAGFIKDKVYGLAGNM
jgi:1-acyl-sn-glycerol-3-phosphate acyltransferase